MKITVTTVRHGMNEVQVSEFLDAYRNDSQARARVDLPKLMQTGSSRTVVHDRGMKIETIITIEK